MKKTYFLADFHLGGAYIPNAREHEGRVVSFLEAIAPEADRLYLLGDILDFWWEYKSVVPQGFIRFFGTLARMADSGVQITWLKGNHDIWIRHYLPKEIGFTLHDGPLQVQIHGKSFFLEHGDGVGELPWAFRKLRGLFRNKFLQGVFSAIHPRIGLGIAHKWSSHSRETGGYVPQSQENSLVKFATEYSALHPGKIDYFIFGHQHIFLDQELATGGRIIILGDWIKRGSYAVFDGEKLTAHQL